MSDVTAERLYDEGEVQALLDRERYETQRACERMQIALTHRNLLGHRSQVIQAVMPIFHEHGTGSEYAQGASDATTRILKLVDPLLLELADCKRRLGERTW